MREFPEYVGKELLAEIGVEVPSGEVLSEPGEVSACEPPAVVKAQVPVSSRGEVGGVRFPADRSELRTDVEQLLGASVGGYDVENVLVEERVDVDRELYVALSADGSDPLPTLMLSSDGGEDIESVPSDRIAAEQINPLVGLQPYHLQNAATTLGDEGSIDSLPIAALEEVLQPVWELFQSRDLRLLEINPLGVVDESLVALDAKVITDDAAAFRQEYPETQTTLSPIEEAAAADGIELRVGPGSVGIISNGAGMGLATLDLIESEPDAGLAAFIDTHGAQFDWDEIHDFLAYLERAGSEVALVNVIGPFLDCSRIAAELSTAVEEGYEVPVVARFKGLEHRRGLEICAEAGIPAETSVAAAVRTAVSRPREGTN